jgi:hypothetical protein
MTLGFFSKRRIGRLNLVAHCLSALDKEVIQQSYILYWVKEWFVSYFQELRGFFFIVILRVKFHFGSDGNRYFFTLKGHSHRFR